MKILLIYLAIILIPNACKADEILVKEVINAFQSIDGEIMISLELQGAAFRKEDKTIKLVNPNLRLIITEAKSNRRIDYQIGKFAFAGKDLSVDLNEIFKIDVNENKTVSLSNEDINFRIKASDFEELERDLTRNLKAPAALQKTWEDFAKAWSEN
jgi:hypothetical protein